MEDGLEDMEGSGEGPGGFTEGKGGTQRAKSGGTAVGGS